jgi:hypothetical protein
VSQRSEILELELNDFRPNLRRSALEELWDLARKGEIPIAERTRAVNLHCHTFYSFNGYGMSPSAVAWNAFKEGLGAIGIVDFDVLDGVEEFGRACKLLRIRGCAGLETRVFVPEFEEREINSPGEPGIAYHMAIGFTQSKLREAGVLPRLKATAQARNRTVIERVNPYLRPIEIDYHRDVLPLTPNGNATERHVCIAYDHKARERFSDPEARARYWAERLGNSPDENLALFADPPLFQSLIRSRIMKAGGVGYIQPEGRDFPTFHEVNGFMRDAFAVPAYAWLDGTSAGERAIDELLALMTSAGVAAINIIPDRNWNIGDPARRAVKVANLHRMVEVAASRELVLSVGTEVNAYGQRFVDDFEAPEMAPLVEPAWDGAMILYGHTVMQACQGMGLTSEWATRRFAGSGERNQFYGEIGKRVDPAGWSALDHIGPEMSPNQILIALS